MKRVKSGWECTLYVTSEGTGETLIAAIRNSQDNAIAMIKSSISGNKNIKYPEFELEPNYVMEITDDV